MQKVQLQSRRLLLRSSGRDRANARPPLPKVLGNHLKTGHWLSVQISADYRWLVFGDSRGKAGVASFAGLYLTVKSIQRNSVIRTWLTLRWSHEIALQLW